MITVEKPEQIIEHKAADGDLILDPKASTDVDGAQLEYAWTDDGVEADQDGAVFTIASPDADKSGTYVATITELAADGKPTGEREKVTFSVTVTVDEPAADPDPDPEPPATSEGTLEFWSTGFAIAVAAVLFLLAVVAIFPIAFAAWRLAFSDDVMGAVRIASLVSVGLVIAGTAFGFTSAFLALLEIRGRTKTWEQLQRGAGGGDGNELADGGASMISADAVKAMAASFSELRRSAAMAVLAAVCLVSAAWVSTNLAQEGDGSDEPGVEQNIDDDQGGDGVDVPDDGDPDDGQ